MSNANLELIIAFQTSSEVWIDAAGSEVWIDAAGSEVWIDAAGSEVWIDAAGSEVWINATGSDRHPISLAKQPPMDKGLH